MKTKNLTIMFTDIKDFTKKTSVYSRKQVENFLLMQENLFTPIIKKYNWNVIKTIWDAYLITFESPTNAILCWMMFQNSVYIHNKNALKNLQTEKEFHVRIWINTWEVNIANSDVFWETVNIASRIEAISEPDEVYFSQSTYLSMNKNEIPTECVWYKNLKWIPEQIKIFKVLKEEAQIKDYFFTRKQNAEISWDFSKDDINDEIFYKKPTNNLLIIIITLFILIFFVIIWVYYYKNIYIKKQQSTLYTKNIKTTISKDLIETENVLSKEKVTQNTWNTISNEEKSKIVKSKINEIKIKKQKDFILNNYKLIQDKDFTSAINNYQEDFRIQKGINLENFNKWYSNVKNINISNIINIWENNYEFLVEIVYDNEEKETYKTNMLIDNINSQYKIIFYSSKKL